MHIRLGDYQQIMFSPLLVLLFLSVACSEVTIDTSTGSLTYSGGGKSIQGRLVHFQYAGPNGKQWNYTVAEFTLTTEEECNIFQEKATRVVLKGQNSLSIRSKLDLKISVHLDLNGIKVEENVGRRLGGYVRTNESCCRTGEKPVYLTIFKDPRSELQHAWIPGNMFYHISSCGYY